MVGQLNFLHTVPESVVCGQGTVFFRFRAANLCTRDTFTAKREALEKEEP